MPWGLKRSQPTDNFHFSTFSCYKRRPNLGSPESRSTFETALERVRQQYELCAYGYVVMPEHVHLLVSEPERGTLAQAMQSLKQGVARRLALRAADSFWLERYYDFNVWTTANSWTSFVTSTAIRSSVGWWSVLRIGVGVVFVII